TELAPCCHKSSPGECFAGFEKSDLLWQGRKIAGAAQRRTREGLLIQGSVQPPPIALNRHEWEEAMCKVVPSEQRMAWHDFEQDTALDEATNSLLREKCSRDSYNRRR